MIKTKLCKTSLVILLAYLASGCSAILFDISDEYVLNSTVKSGIVVGSLTHTRVGNPLENATSFNIEIYKLNNTTEEFLAVVNSRKKSIFTGNHSEGDFTDISGRVFAIELPYGEYVIKSWKVLDFNFNYWPIKYPQELRFKVSEGEVTYVGNVHMIFSVHRNFLGIESVTGVEPLVKYEFTRDINVFKNAYSNLAAYKVSSQVSYTGRWVVD